MIKKILYLTLNPVICLIIPRVLDATLASMNIPRGVGSGFMLFVRILTILAFLMQIYFSVVMFKDDVPGNIIIKIVLVILSVLALLTVSFFNAFYLFVFMV